MGCMKLKPKKNKFVVIRKILLLNILIIFTFFLLFFNKISSITNFYLNYAVIEATKTISSIVNTASLTEEYKKMTYNDLYYITKDNNGSIEMIDYNLNVVNELLDEITSNIQNLLISYEEKEILTIPFGIITNNPMFNNIGPKIPVHLKLISSVLTNLNTYIKDYGINSSIIEVSINIEVRAKVILPVLSKDIVITNDLPISYKIINGNIPEYYSNNGYTKSSNLYQIPLE